YLIAHEVGLGKTIIALIALKELLLNKKIKKVLLIVPASLVEQWIKDEIEKKNFEIDFKVVDGTARKVEGSEIWNKYSKIITSIDFIKFYVEEDNLQAIKWDALP
ncbi:MAG: SNF2-related protein, partial [Methanosarcinales archaeon]